MKVNDWLSIIANNPIAFGMDVGFGDFSEIHNSWLKSFLFKEADYTLQAHRGSYKTTIISIAIALMIVLYPDKTILFMRKTDQDIKEIVLQISKMLERDIFNDMSFALYGRRIEFRTRTAFEITTNLQISARGTSQLTGVGSKGSITGKHFDVIVTDDIVNLSDRVSKAEREHTKLIYQELQNIKNRGGRIINCGTPWHKDDAFSLMPPAETFDCYSTGLMTDKDIADVKEKMTRSLFSANYELKHISSEEALFTDPILDNGTNTEKIYDGVCHIDAAYGGGGGDSVAFTIAKKSPDGKIYVYGLLRTGHVDDHLDEFERRRAQYRAGTLYNETNADKGYLLKKIKQPRKGYHENMNKFIKITSYIKPEWRQIVFIQGTDDEYVNQIIDYNEQATHDDAPDSLASVLRILHKPISVDRTAQQKAIRYLGL